MRFYIREVAGWVLVVLGLVLFYQVFAFLTREPYPAFLESGPLLLMGIFVFRGGIHLLKVAVAARICMQAADGEAGRPRAGGERRPAPLTGTVRPAGIR